MSLTCALAKTLFHNFQAALDLIRPLVVVPFWSRGCETLAFGRLTWTHGPFGEPSLRRSSLLFGSGTIPVQHGGAVFRNPPACSKRVRCHAPLTLSPPTTSECHTSRPDSATEGSTTGHRNRSR